MVHYPDAHSCVGEKTIADREIMILLKGKLEATQECPQWIHTAWSSTSHTAAQTCQPGSDNDLCKRSAAQAALTTPPFNMNSSVKPFSSSLLPTFPLSSGISPSAQLVFPLRFLLLSHGRDFMFLLTIICIRICDEFLLELLVFSNGQISSH